MLLQIAGSPETCFCNAPIFCNAPAGVEHANSSPAAPPGHEGSCCNTCLFRTAVARNSRGAWLPQ